MTIFVFAALIISVVGTLCTPTEAFAYIDPGTGSLLLQSLATGAIAASLFWRRIISFIRRILKRGKI